MVDIDALCAHIKRMRIDMTRRDVRVPVVMTAEEHRIIKDAAEAAGVGTSTYLRQKALEAARGKN